MQSFMNNRRQDKLFEQLQRNLNFTIMQRARESEDYNKKELCHKHKTRQNEIMKQI